MNEGWMGDERWNNLHMLASFKKNIMSEIFAKNERRCVESTIWKPEGEWMNDEIKGEGLEGVSARN